MDETSFEMSEVKFVGIVYYILSISVIRIHTLLIYKDILTSHGNGVFLDQLSDY